MQQLQPITPTIVKVVPPPTPQVSVVDILVGGLGLTGVIVVASILLGLAVGALLIWFQRWRANRSGEGGESDATRLDLSSPTR
jgi:hypothetical protein